MDKLSQAVLDNAPLITEALLKQVDLYAYLHIFGICAGVILIVVGFIVTRANADGFEWVIAGIVWAGATITIVTNGWWLWVALQNPVYYAITLLPR